MAAGQLQQLTGYMFDPESDPDAQEETAEEPQPRQNRDVSEWLVFGNSTFFSFPVNKIKHVMHQLGSHYIMGTV